VSPLFVAAGEILVDFTPIVEAGATVGFRMHPGGSPFNVAVALARLGARVEFAGKASTDFFGRYLVSVLQREGVGMRFLSRSGSPSTLAFVALDEGEPAFSFYGGQAADTELQPADLPAAIEQATVLHFGSISLLATPTAETIAGLVDRLRGRALLSFDPNIRPGLIRDAPAYRRRVEGLLGAADVVRLSAADARWLLPGVAVPEAARALRARGPLLVVITLGEQGCHAAAPGGVLHVPAVEVPVVDTVGAGDTFTAALLFHLASHGYTSRPALEGLPGEALETALRFAGAAAALTCTRAGADPPRREEVESLLHRGRASPG